MSNVAHGSIYCFVVLGFLVGFWCGVFFGVGGWGGNLLIFRVGGLFANLCWLTSYTCKDYEIQNAVYPPFLNETVFKD